MARQKSTGKNQISGDSIFDWIVRIAIFVLAMTLAVNGIYLSNTGQHASATLNFVTTVLVLIFVFLSRFKKFKGLGIEAELWEDTQKEAEKLVETLTDISVVQARYMTRFGTYLGRWDSALSVEELYDLERAVQEMLTATKAPPEEIKQQLETIKYFIVSDILRALTDRHSEYVAEANKRSPSLEKLETSKRALEEKLKDIKQDFYQAPELYREFIRTHDILNEDEKREFLSENEVYLTGLENYLEKGTPPTPVPES